MRKQITKLIALISTSLAYNQSGVAMQNLDDIKPDTIDSNQLNASVLNTKVSVELAAHRSHSSHSSHRSSSSSGYSGSSSPSPTYSAPKKTKPKVIKADPVGQEKRLKGSYPTDEAKKDLEKNLKNKKMKANITKRIQLTLQIEGYYKGPIDGVMSKKLQDAAYAFKKAKGIPGYAIYDAVTLNAMGIIGY